MSATPQHWIATDAGSARAGNEDAFLWLSTEETADNGQLWLVVDGEGGEGVGDLAAAMVIVTVGELYGELLDLHRDPVAALEVALREADRRLETIAQVYPRLVGVRASYAAVALFEGRLHPVVAGTAAIFAVRNGEVERIGASDIKKHHRDATDPDPVPGSGVGIYGPVRQQAGEPLDPERVSLFLCTDGVTETVPDGLIGQAVERLSPKDAVEGLIELARRRWGDDDATAALVRFADPNLQAHTTVDAFLDWAESGMTRWPDRTLMLKLGSASAHEIPPRTNVESLPPIVGEEVAPGADERVIAHTMSFSAEQVRGIVEASTSAPAEPAASSEDAVAPSAEPAASDGAPPGAPPPPAPLQGPVTSAGGTFIFSPQQMAQVRAAAGIAEPDAAAAAPPDPAPGAEAVPPGPAPPSSPGDAPVPSTVPSATPNPTTVPSATPHPATEPITGGSRVTADAEARADRDVDIAHTGDLGGDGGDGAEVPRTAEFRGVTGAVRPDTSADDTETVQREPLTSAELRTRPGVLVPVLLLIVAAAAAALGVWFALR